MKPTQQLLKLQAELSVDADVVSKVEDGWGRGRVWGWLKEHRQYPFCEKSVAEILRIIRLAKGIPNPTNQCGGRGKVPESPIPKETTIDQHDTKIERTPDTISINAKYSPYQTEPEVREAYNLPVDEWDCVKFTVGSWNGFIKNAQKEIEKTTLNSLQCMFKKRVRVIAAKEEIRFLFEQAKLGMPAFNVVGSRTRHGKHLVELSCTDLHIGKPADVGATGNEYDPDIAVNTWMTTTDDLLYKADRWLGDCEKIVFCVGNDMLHIDNLSGTTTKGTQMEYTGTYQQLYRKAATMLFATINKLTEYAPVHVVVCPGNHDMLSAWLLGYSIELRFDGHPHVTIDNSEELMKCLTWESTLIAYTHGSEERIESLSRIVSSQFDKAWGETDWHEIHLGHSHKMADDEVNGFVVRICPSLSAQDRWHCKSGFVGNARSGRINVYCPEQGHIAQFKSNLVRPTKRNVTRL